jgi:hypothetical protein
MKKADDGETSNYVETLNDQHLHDVLQNMPYSLSRYALCKRVLACCNRIRAILWLRHYRHCALGLTKETNKKRLCNGFCNSATLRKDYLICKSVVIMSSS